MNATFTLHLQSATQYECIDNVRCFVGEDASGHFALLANHETFLTALIFDVISQQLRERLLAEERELQSVKQSLKHMEEQMLKHLWDLQKQRAD